MSYTDPTRPIWGIVPDQSTTESRLESEHEIQSYLMCHPVIARLLWNRGFRSAQVIDRFFNPDLSQLPDPRSIFDMGKAVERVAAAIAGGEKIAIYGDYDVDGTCGVSILADFLRALGVSPTVYQPNRFTEGYGVHTKAVVGLIDEGAQVIVTVDCGITAVEPARVARDRGVDMIVIDHHKLGAEFPPAFAVVNPQRPEDESGLLNLCGAGLAFFFVIALRAELRGRGFFGDGRAEPNLMKLLDLVAVATVADVVDIRGINRILVSHGLRVLAKSPRPGLRAILEAARIEKPSTMHCGFIIGPRINAAGRLKSARAAFELLTSTDLDAARKLAAELERVNTARRQAQDSVYAQAREQALAFLADERWPRLASDLPAASLGPWPRALVLATPVGEGDGEDGGWHEGVVGIVASKISEEFKRPTFILASREGEAGVLKGSVRSWSKIDILASIAADGVAEHLLNFGGHAFAGGVSLTRTKLEEFFEAINRQLAMVTDESHFKKERRHDAEVQLSEIDAKLIEELERLEPFGHEFPEPTLKVSNVAPRDVQVLKEKHLKMKCGAGDGAAGGTKPGKGIDAVWFNAFKDERTLQSMDQFRAGSPCCLWVSPQWNEWQGTRRLQLQIKHAEVM